MSTDALTLLKKDHKKVRKQFDKFKAAGPDAKKEKQRTVDKIIELLSVHTYVENECLYPVVLKSAPDLEPEILESYEEHHVADVLMMEIASLKPSDSRFDAKVTVLIESVDHHIDEEENEWFPKVRNTLSRGKLKEIGEEMLAKRDEAPRKPGRKSALRRAVDTLLRHSA